MKRQIDIERFNMIPSEGRDEEGKKDQKEIRLIQEDNLNENVSNHIFHTAKTAALCKPTYGF